MYRRSSKTNQLDLFSRADTLLRGKALKVYNDAEKWHNQFRIQVTNRIDEDLFRPLFHEDFGAPNASIRVLIGMMILKEARGWSDAQLYEEETYENLIEKAFAQVTKSQAMEFQINGARIRMDSKLLGSNIAWYSRYELIHDTDCEYRKKDDQQVKGYAINVTETCDSGDSFNLVTIETANADGAYHSPENQAYCKENGIEFILGAIQGKPSRYDLSRNETGDSVVTDLETGTTISPRKVAPRKEDSEPKWAILNEKNQYRYFTQKDIDTCLLRKQVTTRSQEELNRRNNVEATILQLGYHYPNAKSRYRTLVKHKMWASCRCFWINFVRIANFVARINPYYALKSVKRRIFSHLCAKNVKFVEKSAEVVVLKNDLTEWTQI